MKDIFALIELTSFAVILYLTVCFIGKVYSITPKKNQSERKNEDHEKLLEFIHRDDPKNKPLFPEHSKAIKDIKNDKHVSTQPAPASSKPQPNLSKYELMTRSDQGKLDAYFNSLTAETINIAYMRYVGHLFEVKGYNVNYYGIRKGISDSSIDLIVYDEFETIFVKCAYRTKDRAVGERVILGFHEACISWAALHISHPILEHGVIINMVCTNSELTLKAMQCAYNFDVKRIDKLYLDTNYPLIKCLNHPDLGYVYVLPWEDIYDNINTTIFLKTTKEADDEYVPLAYAKEND